MATEADIGEVILLKEKCLTPGELCQPPQTDDYLVNMEVASNVPVEIVNSSFEGNAGVTAGESFSESPLIAKLPDKKTNIEEETCQAKEISYPGEKLVDQVESYEQASVKVNQMNIEKETITRQEDDGSGKEKNLSSMELNQKNETEETDKISSETHSVGEENLLVERKELGRDSNLEPQGQLHEASGDRHDENKNENDSQACESTENNANRGVTAEQNSETSAYEIEKLENVQELGSQDQSAEIKDGEMSLKEDNHEEEEACETEKHKRSNEEIPDSILQNSSVQEQENLITSEDSLAKEISMTNDKENHTNEPEAETGEHKEILKGVEYLEQIMQKYEKKENNEHILNVTSADTEATLSPSNANIVLERVDLAQDDESEADTTKEDITNGSYIGRALQEAVDEDPVIFQKNESYIGHSNAESPQSGKLDEKIEIAEGETPEKKINELNVTHLLEKEPGESTNFETQEQVHEENGRDEEKNDETESQACKGTENTNPQHLSAKEAENSKASEEEAEKSEKVHASESKEEVENKDVEMIIEENIGNKEKSCEEDIQNLETSDNAENFHTEEVLNHEKIAQNFEAEEISTTSEGEENSRQTISVIDKEITAAEEITDDENIKENVTRLSSEVTNKETAESSQEAEKEGYITAAENTEGKIILQKSIEEEEDAEQTSLKDDFEQPLNVMSLETKAEALSQIDNITIKETAEIPQENEERDAGTEKEVGLNESNSKCLQLESVAQNSAKDFENDKGIEKSNTEILEESEVVERGQSIIHEANRTDETSNETMQSSIAKEEESVLFEDKGIPEKTSLEEKKEEGSSIMLLEEENKEIDKQISEPVHFALEINQNEESLNSTLQTSVGTETVHTLQEEPQEKVEQPLNNMEEDAETEKQEDGVSERKSYTEILEQPEAVESIENITHEIDQNDIPDTITSEALAEDTESLQYEDKDIAEEKKEEPSSVKTGEDNNGSIPVIEENNIEGDQDTSKPDDYSADDKIQSEESLSSSTQASELREEVTLGSDNLTPAEAFTKKDEDRENYTAQIEVGEHNKEDAEETLHKVAQDPITNFKNDDDGAETSNKEILEQTKAEQSVESITDETNQNDSPPSETNPAAPPEDVQSLQFEDKEIAIEVSTEEKKEEPSSIKTSEDRNEDIIMIEENNKEGDQETCKTGGYSAHEMTQNEESLSSSIQASLVREEETVGSDNLTPVEASIKNEEEKESYTGLIDVENNAELVEKENEEQILHKDEPRESTEEPLDVIYMETKAEALNEFKETADTPQDNEKRDRGREKEGATDESNIRSLPLESVAQNPVKFFENDDPMEKTGEEFQDNTKNTEIPKEEEDDHDTKEHIRDEGDIKSISKEPINEGTTKEIQNDEDNDKISNKEILEESLKGEIGDSIALETNQNYETTNTTAPVKEGESLQDESENVNLEEPSLEAKEDDGPLAKASQVNGCDAELSEATKQSEAERSHGEVNMEPILQNEPEEFLDSLSDVNTQVSDISILDKNVDEISIAEDLQTVQNNENTEEEETKGNEDSDGSKLNDVSASEDIKLTAETYYANEADLETTKAHVSDYSEKNGEHISENSEKEINENNITKFQGDNTACMNEDAEKHIIMEEQLSKDILAQLDGEETNLIQENKEEMDQIEMHKEFELPHKSEDTAQHDPEEIDIEKDQCTESATVIADDVAVIVPKTEMHEIIQADVENSNTGEEIVQEGREVEDILEVPLRGIDAEGLPEKDTDDENDKVKSKQEVEGTKSQLKEESAAVCYELETMENLKDKQGSDIDLYHVKASEEGTMPRESTELDTIYLESSSKEETLGKERSIAEVEEEDRKQIESSGPHNQEEGLERVETTGTPLDRTSINAPHDEAPNWVENNDHEIQTETGRAEDLRFEIQDKVLDEGSNNHNETVAFATLSDKTPDHNLKEGSLFPSNDNSEKDPTIGENLENKHISQVTELAEEEDKIKTEEEIPELAIVGIEKVRENEEAESCNSRNLNQDLELHNEQYQVDQQEMCKSETDYESSDVGDDALKCTESNNADKEEDILDKEGFPNKSKASLKEKDAAEKATNEHVAENINQVAVTSETESSGVPAEENLESAEPSMKLGHISEMLPSNQSSETIPKSSPNKFEENQISESVEQRSKGSPGSWQEIEEKTEPDLEDKNQIDETIDVENIKASIFTKEVCREVEKAEGDETVDHFNMDGDGIKELQSAPTGCEIIHEVKESSLVSSEYLKVTDSNQPTETEVREAQNFEKEASVTKENEETKEDDEDYQRNIGLLHDVPSKETQEVIKEQIIEESKETSDVYETKNHDARELHTGEVREEIKEAAETVDSSREKEIVTEAEAVTNHTPPKEIMKEPEVPPLALSCKEEDCQTESTINNIEKHTEKVEMTKDKPPENSSALNTVEDRSLQIEVLDVSQLDLQVKKGSPDSPTEEHKEKGGTLCDTKEESEINEVADDQTLHSEKSDEQYQTETFVLLSNEMEFGCSTQTEKLEEVMKGEELLGGEPRKSEEACLRKEESSDLQVSEPELEAEKDAEESLNEAEMEVNVTSIEIGNKKEASESKLDSNSEGNEAANEEVVEEITPVQTNYTDKSHEENSMPSNPLLPKEQEGEASTITVSIEEKAKEMQSLEYKPEAIQDACLQKEEPVELKVPSSEFQPHKDEQENLKETHEKADEAINGVKEETEEDKITSNQPQPTEKPKEENQKSVAGLLFEEQEHKISTIAESIEGKTTREEEPENAPKTIEEQPLKKEEPREFKPSGLELQIGDDIQNKSQKNDVHDGEEGTVEESHEIEKINAEKMDFVALEDQGEKTIDATEVMHTKVTNEEIMEEKSYAKSSHAITPGEDATKESHQEQQQIIEETPGAQIYEKMIQNEVDSSVETSPRGDAFEIIQHIHHEEEASESTHKDKIKEPETMEKEVVGLHQEKPNMEKAKSDEEEEEEEEGDEKKRSDSGSDGAVMVESSKDIQVKIGEKKSHNILAGVGSKVKHSIIKVKKAITGGGKSSSQTKQHQNHGCFAP